MRPMGRNTLGYFMLFFGSLSVFGLAAIAVGAHIDSSYKQREVYLWAFVITAVLLLFAAVSLRVLRFYARSAPKQNGRRETPGARTSSAFDANER